MLLPPPPAHCTAAWARTVAGVCFEASNDVPEHTLQYLPQDRLVKILRAARQLFDAEPTLLELQPPANLKIHVVGDLHGQLPDLLQLFELAGEPSQEHWYIFNGDYVDRGCWGLEVFITLLAWKLAFPTSVYLIRGDHEALSPTYFYGFKAELAAKLGLDHYKVLYTVWVDTCAHMPLAALVCNRTLIMHGGLWRDPEYFENTGKLRVGRLSHLRASGKGGPDPDASPEHLVASDVLWSDPSHRYGLRENMVRGQGTLFGPDATEKFLRAERLQLIIRSHEAPDAREARRENRVKLPAMVDGYSIDHKLQCGMLMTLFSAPRYPMFTDEDNPAAVALLSGPNFNKPSILPYTAAPRHTALTRMFMLDESQRGAEVIEGQQVQPKTAVSDDMLWRNTPPPALQSSAGDDNDVEGDVSGSSAAVSPANSRPASQCSSPDDAQASLQNQSQNGTAASEPRAPEADRASTVKPKDAAEVSLLLQDPERGVTPGSRSSDPVTADVQADSRQPSTNSVSGRGSRRNSAGQGAPGGPAASTGVAASKTLNTNLYASYGGAGSLCFGTLSADRHHDEDRD